MTWLNILQPSVALRDKRKHNRIFLLDTCWSIMNPTCIKSSGCISFYVNEKKKSSSMKFILSLNLYQYFVVYYLKDQWWAISCTLTCFHRNFYLSSSKVKQTLQVQGKRILLYYSNQAFNGSPIGSMLSPLFTSSWKESPVVASC